MSRELVQGPQDMEYQTYLRQLEEHRDLMRQQRRVLKQNQDARRSAFDDDERARTDAQHAQWGAKMRRIDEFRSVKLFPELARRQLAGQLEMDRVPPPHANPARTQRTLSTPATATYGSEAVLRRYGPPPPTLRTTRAAPGTSATAAPDLSNGPIYTLRGAGPPPLRASARAAHQSSAASLSACAAELERRPTEADMGVSALSSYRERMVLRRAETDRFLASLNPPVPGRGPGHGRADAAGGAGQGACLGVEEAERPLWRYSSPVEAKARLAAGPHNQPLSHTCPYDAETMVQRRWRLESEVLRQGRPAWTPSSASDAKWMVERDCFLNSVDADKKRAELAMVRHENVQRRRRLAGLRAYEIDAQAAAALAAAATEGADSC